jgi:hypothetical protein
MSTDERNSSATPAAKSVVVRAMREPLLQFLAIALVLFITDQLINGDVVRPSGELIVISQGRVHQIADSYRLLAGRMPSRAELQALVNDFADEEIAYREAIAMGLDADDTIVRRRMRQKLEFMAEDAEASAEPTDAELAAWLTEHAAEYRLPERISFRQVMASTDARGKRTTSEAVSLLNELRAGADPTKLGDPSMLPSALPPTTQQSVADLFGEAFAEGLFAHSDDRWFGPIVSPLGAHVVLILSRESARDPVLADIRDKLRSDWIEAQRRDRREQFQARLRERYEVSIEWPQIYAAQPVPADVPKLKRPLDTIDTRGE